MVRVRKGEREGDAGMNVCPVCNRRRIRDTDRATYSITKKGHLLLATLRAEVILKDAVMPAAEVSPMLESVRARLRSERGA